MASNWKAHGNIVQAQQTETEELNVQCQHMGKPIILLKHTLIATEKVKDYLLNIK